MNKNQLCDIPIKTDYKRNIIFWGESFLLLFFLGLQIQSTDYLGFIF